MEREPAAQAAGSNWVASNGRNWVASRGATVVGSQQGSVGWGGRLPQTSTKWASGGGSQAEACRRDPRWQAYSAEVTLRERGGKPFVTWT